LLDGSFTYALIVTFDLVGSQEAIKTSATRNYLLKKKWNFGKSAWCKMMPKGI